MKRIASALLLAAVPTFAQAPRRRARTGRAGGAGRARAEVLADARRLRRRPGPGWRWWPAGRGNQAPNPAPREYSSKRFRRRPQARSGSCCGKSLATTPTASPRRQTAASSSRRTTRATSSSWTGTERRRSSTRTTNTGGALSFNARGTAVHRRARAQSAIWQLLPKRQLLANRYNDDPWTASAACSTTSRPTAGRRIHDERPGLRQSERRGHSLRTGPAHERHRPQPRREDAVCHQPGNTCGAGCPAGWLADEPARVRQARRRRR